MPLPRLTPVPRPVTERSIGAQCLCRRDAGPVHKREVWRAAQQPRVDGNVLRDTAIELGRVGAAVCA